MNGRLRNGLLLSAVAGLAVYLAWTLGDTAPGGPAGDSVAGSPSDGEGSGDAVPEAEAPEAAPSPGDGAVPGGTIPDAAGAAASDAAALEGPFPLDEVGAVAVVSAYRVRIGACRKLTAASVSGDLRVELVVKPTLGGESGFVGAVEVREPGRALLGACLTDALAPARFPAPPTPDGARLAITLPPP